MDQNIMGIDLKLNQEYIKASVEEIVKAGIISALGSPDEIVKTAIDKTINMKNELLELIELVKAIAIEQGTREFSGITWCTEILTKLDRISQSISEKG